MTVATLIIAILAFLVSVASAGYTKKQADASKKQAEQAEQVTAIERKRYHSDLTPEFHLECMGRDPDGRQSTLTVELTGPPGLDWLDEVTVHIRDDRPDRTPGEGRSPEYLEEFSHVIWGPYRIKSGLEKTGRDGRTHGPFKLLKNEPYPIPLEHSYPPSWDTGNWRSQYNGKAIRLEIACTRQGHEPWVLTPEVKVKYPPFIL